jgi:hypothetical protein
LQCSAVQGDVIQPIDRLGTHTAQHNTSSSASKGHMSQSKPQLFRVTRVRLSGSQAPATTPAGQGHSFQPLEGKSFCHSRSWLWSCNFAPLQVTSFSRTTSWPSDIVHELPEVTFRSQNTSCSGSQGSGSEGHKFSQNTSWPGSQLPASEGGSFCHKTSLLES